MLCILIHLIPTHVTVFERTTTYDANDDSQVEAAAVLIA